MDEQPGVSEIICADYDLQAAEKLSGSLDKATAMQLDARDVKAVIKAAAGCDLIVNGLPLEYDLTVMEAALAVEASYLDMAGPMEDIGFVESYKLIFSKWHPKFKEKGLTALVGCGSSPGLANVIARQSVDKLDTCNAIGIYIYEGVWTNRFTPFWWSPEVALGDMAYSTFRYARQCRGGICARPKKAGHPLEWVGIKATPTDEGGLDGNMHQLIRLVY